jgi:hypothetical protein
VSEVFFGALPFDEAGVGVGDGVTCDFPDFLVADAARLADTLESNLMNQFRPKFTGENYKGTSLKF